MSGFYGSASGMDVEAKGDDARRKSTIVDPTKHRKSTVVVDNPVVVDYEGLSAEDRHLAEMGYVQVSISHLDLRLVAC